MNLLIKIKKFCKTTRFTVKRKMMGWFKFGRFFPLAKFAGLKRLPRFADLQ
jgi:hypothetical protein